MNLASSILGKISDQTRIPWRSRYENENYKFVKEQMNNK